MRCLLIANVFPPMTGGSAAVYDNLCRCFDGDIVVIASKRRHLDGAPVPHWREHDARLPYPVHRIDLLRAPIRPAPRSSLVSVWRHITEDRPLRFNLRRAVFGCIESYKPDVICLGDLSALAWIGPQIQGSFHLPVVQIVHGEEITTAPGSRLQHAEAQRALQDAQAVMTVSDFTRAQVIAQGVRPHRVTLITNGVDTGRFTPGLAAVSTVERFGLQNHAILLTVARIEERKGHESVIRAMPRILAAVPNALYVVAGEGSYEPVLRRLVAELGLERQVVFTGAIPNEELPDVYRACHVFIMPNRTLPNGDTEGFGLVFLEAGACGKPVIGGHAGGVPDAVRNGVTGILVDGWSPGQVAEAAIRLLTDNSLAGSMAAAGIRHARENDWRKKGREFSRLCAAVAEEHRASRTACLSPPRGRAVVMNNASK